MACDAFLGDRPVLDIGVGVGRKSRELPETRAMGAEKAGEALVPPESTVVLKGVPRGRLLRSPRTARELPRGKSLAAKQISFLTVWRTLSLAFRIII